MSLVDRIKHGSEFIPMLPNLVVTKLCRVQRLLPSPTLPARSMHLLQGPPKLHCQYQLVDQVDLVADRNTYWHFAKFALHACTNHSYKVHLLSPVCAEP